MASSSTTFFLQKEYGPKNPSFYGVAKTWYPAMPAKPPMPCAIPPDPCQHKRPCLVKYTVWHLNHLHTVILVPEGGSQWISLWEGTLAWAEPCAALWCVSAHPTFRSLTHSLKTDINPTTPPSLLMNCSSSLCNTTNLNYWFHTSWSFDQSLVDK